MPDEVVPFADGERWSGVRLLCRLPAVEDPKLWRLTPDGDCIIAAHPEHKPLRIHPGGLAESIEVE